MNALFILNDQPYGSERSYNGLRLAIALAKHDPAGTIAVFLMGDAVTCGKKGQKTPDGYYNIERMLKRFATGDHRVLLCGTCMDARGLSGLGARRRCAAEHVDDLAEATAAADKVLVF